MKTMVEGILAKQMGKVSFLYSYRNVKPSEANFGSPAKHK